MNYSLFRSKNDLTYEKIVLELKDKLVKEFDIQHRIDVDFTKLPNKAKTTLNKNGRILIQFDLNRHSNKEDVVTSVYHELRHIMQYDFADMQDIIKWKKLGEDDPNWYYISPYEMDARIFAKRRGKVEGINIIEEIGKPPTWPPDKEFFFHILDVGHKYNDIGLFEEYE